MDCHFDQSRGLCPSISKTMNKIISTHDRVFMSLVGPSGCGKTQLIFQMLENGTFHPQFDKILYFYQHHQDIYDKMQSRINNIEFIKCIDFELIDSLPADGTNYLLIFDDSCSEISRCREFEKLATAGRHKKLNVIYIKHNLFHKSPLGRDIELQNTHIVLFKSPRDINQIQRFGQQLGLGKQFSKWYEDATNKPFGHLLIDLTPRTNDKLRFSTNIGQFPTKYYLPPSQARITVVDDDYSKRLYTQGIPNFLAVAAKDFSKSVPERLYQIPLRVYKKSHSGKLERQSIKGRKIQKTHKKPHSQKAKSARKETIT